MFIPEWMVPHRPRRRGAALFSVAIGTPLLLSFAALSIDVGFLYMVKAQLQNSADAAALAGASVYFTDAGLTQDQGALTLMARTQAAAAAQHNPVLRQGLILEAADVTLGQHDSSNHNGPLLPYPRWDAVEVRARRTADSPNGPAPLFFAGIFGRHQTNVVALARAVASDRVAGYSYRQEPALLPFTMAESKYKYLVQNGTDNWSYNSGPVNQGDGIREVKLFPWKWDETIYGPDAGGEGNFGTLTIGSDSQSTAVLDAQIRSGITASDFQTTFGTTQLTFYDDEHTQETGPRTYQAPGNPGLSVGMEDAIRTRVGQVIGFFVNRQVTKSGANAVYEISGVAYGRVMAVDLSGGPDVRRFVIQPVTHNGSSIVIHQDAAPTGGQMGHVVMVR